jgi:hypothetical protein
MPDVDADPKADLVQHLTVRHSARATMRMKLANLEWRHHILHTNGSPDHDHDAQGGVVERGHRGEEDRGGGV